MQILICLPLPTAVQILSLLPDDFDSGPDVPIDRPVGLGGQLSRPHVSREQLQDARFLYFHRDVALI